MTSPARTTVRKTAARPADPPGRTTPALAPMGRRVAGAAIDMVVLVLVSGILASALDRMTAGITRVRIDAASGERIVDAALRLPLWLPIAILVALTGVYTVVLMAVFGRTLGGWAMGIRCVRVDEPGGRGGIGWSRATRRWFVLYGAAGLLAFFPFVGPFSWVLILVVGLSPLWDGTRCLRGYADHLGHDIVVMAAGSTSR